jgi:hypothetical protein
MSEVLELEAEAKISPPGVQNVERSTKAQISGPKLMQNVDVEFTDRVEFLPRHVQFGMLRHPRLAVQKPIPLEVTRTDRTVVATWDTVNEFGYGETWSEAVEDFSKTIAELFISLESQEAQLSADLKNVLAVLREHISKRR